MKSVRVGTSVPVFGGQNYMATLGNRLKPENWDKWRIISKCPQNSPGLPENLFGWLGCPRLLTKSSMALPVPDPICVRFRSPEDTGKPLMLRGKNVLAKQLNVLFQPTWTFWKPHFGTVTYHPNLLKFWHHDLLRDTTMSSYNLIIWDFSKFYFLCIISFRN